MSSDDICRQNSGYSKCRDEKAEKTAKFRIWDKVPEACALNFLAPNTLNTVQCIGNTGKSQVRGKER